MNIKLTAAVVAGLVTMSAPAQATITVYTSLASFNAATSAQGTDTFDSFTNNASATASPITRTAGSYSYTATTSNLSPTALGFFGAGSGTDRWLSTNYALDTVTFNGWNSSVRAVGGNFFGSDINGLFSAGDIILVATDSTGAVTRTILSAQTTSFLGFVSTGGLSSLVLSATQPTGATLWPTVNNLVLAQAAATPVVPEPATWAMMLVGFAMVGAATRYRRRHANVRFA